MYSEVLYGATSNGVCFIAQLDSGEERLDEKKICFLLLMLEDTSCLMLHVLLHVGVLMLLAVRLIMIALLPTRHTTTLLRK